MTKPKETHLWRKAAVLGSLWAASEIVLGSFIHNARIPLGGQILTGIGIAMLVAGHVLWPERGLIWRAGLICAAMKSVSPSAVILGPMIAISMEGFLLEAGVFLAGANLVGYALGGGLAMSWALFHKIGNIFLFYGPETWALYTGSLEHLRSWMGRSSGSPWTPLFLLWATHFLGGGAVAAIGWSIGRQSASEGSGLAATAPPRTPAPRRDHAVRAYSLTALILHVLFVIAAMSMGQTVSLWVCLCVALFYACLCVAGYARARAIMSRVGLWTGIFIVAALAGLLTGRWDSGVRMGLRAVLLTLGFSCIGEELCNPLLVAWMERRGAGVFFHALEQAFETLPEVMAGLPSAPVFLKNPAVALRNAVARAPALLEGLSIGRVIIISGGQGTGKSSAVSRLADDLRRAGLSVGGIHAPGLWDAGQREGFDIVDLRAGDRRLLCRRGGAEDWPAVGPFRFSPEGLRIGRQALSDARRHGVDVLFVDEVGYLELQGRGWAEELDVLVRERRKPMVWVVRSCLVNEVKKRWSLVDAPVLEAGQVATDAILAGGGIRIDAADLAR